MSVKKNRKHQKTPSPKRALIAQVLAELLLLMATVETKSAEAKLNEASMDDNNGGRIWF